MIVQNELHASLRRKTASQGIQASKEDDDRWRNLHAALRCTEEEKRNLFKIETPNLATSTGA